MTERLILAPADPSHEPASRLIHQDPDVARFIGGVVEPEQLQSAIRRDIYRTRRPGLGYWAVFRRIDARRQIGVGLLTGLEERFNAVELGYFFVKSAWGKGYARETAEALAAYGFDVLGLPRIVAVTDLDNRASQSVLAKIGFRRSADRIAYGERSAFFQAFAGTWQGF